jgi:hypothetical protein
MQALCREFMLKYVHKNNMLHIANIAEAFCRGLSGEITNKVWLFALYVGS